MGKKNGHATTGFVNMGNKDGKSHENYNFTDREDTKAGHLLLAAHPDSIVCMAKYHRGEKGEYAGHIATVLHGDIDYKYPYETEVNKKQYLVAQSVINVMPTKEWKRFSAPFAYSGVSPKKTYLLVNITTSNFINESAEDTLIVDDVKLVYNSELSKVVYNGTNYPLSQLLKSGIDAPVFDEKKLEVFPNGHAATYEVDASKVKASHQLIITIKGGDVAVNAKNQHVYTIKVNDKTSGIENSLRCDNSKRVYNLQGKQVKHMKGIVIVDGRKILK